jgi:sterol desaturase/sphingolipid hydroxylase (fatty acid hydroxylase superfamily)
LQRRRLLAAALVVYRQLSDAMQFALYALPVVFLLLLALEQAFPLRKASRPLRRRLVANACVGALALITAVFLVKPVTSALLPHGPAFGILSLVAWPQSAQWIIGFLLLDLSFYYWHRANHASRFLWRFHNAHHIDPDLDVSTAFRFHFLEIGLSAAFRALQIMLIGGSPGVFIAYEFVFQLNTLFQHSNVRLAIVAERWLSMILVTPRMHGIHHSQVREEINSNWSSVLSCWDRLHGTLRLNIPQLQVEIGIPGYLLPEDNRVSNILIMPFRTQRDYWRRPSGTNVTRPSKSDDVSRSHMVQ